MDNSTPSQDLTSLDFARRHARRESLIKARERLLQILLPHNPAERARAMKDYRLSLEAL